MREDNIPERLDIQYKSPPVQDAPSTPKKEHAESGASSLYGRVGDNLTFHSQGAFKRGFYELYMKRIWKEFGGVLLGLFRVFLPTRDK